MSKNAVKWGEHSIPRRLLKLFRAYPSSTLSFKFLWDSIWQNGPFDPSCMGTIYVNVCYARRILGEGERIVSTPRRGYVYHSSP